MAAPPTPGGARSNAAILGQVGIMVAVPIVVGAWLGQKLDESAGTAPWGLLGLTFLGMAIAGIGIAYMIRRYMNENPVGPVSERAREAGRRWQAEIDERERRRDAGEDE
ncbi:MAG: AtpZ/AtpI family protein [Chloroflexi bacterium]|nr:MAG: AtpZ/AtpI family protein [Chloroflexota bacterium]TMG66575.1 MAG: AtpZ/AtpI family protein [Chloroflexota bacterium]